MMDTERKVNIREEFGILFAKGDFRNFMIV